MPLGPELEVAQLSSRVICPPRSRSFLHQLLPGFKSEARGETRRNGGREGKIEKGFTSAAAPLTNSEGSSFQSKREQRRKLEHSGERDRSPHLVVWLMV